MFGVGAQTDPARHVVRIPIGLIIESETPAHFLITKRCEVYAVKCVPALLRKHGPSLWEDGTRRCGRTHAGIVGRRKVLYQRLSRPSVV